MPSMVADIAQLPPVLDRLLYSPSTEHSISMIGLIANRDLDHAVILDRNRRASSEDKNEFKGLLLRLSNEDVKLSD